MSNLEIIDLGGYDEAQVRTYVMDHFTKPMEGAEPIKLTFVVGAGKGDRQKYHPDLSKYMTTALRELGFEEDRAASACKECMGTFKSQHDTSKNLKFMHVFPHVDLKSGNEASAQEICAEQRGVHLLCASCEFDTFKEMVAVKTQSWGQRKRLCRALQDMAERFEVAEAKMIRMEALSPEEQVLYDSTSADLLAEKVTWLTAALKRMADEGQLTAREKTQVLAQIDAKLAALPGGKREAEGDDGGDAEPPPAAPIPPKVQKQREALSARRRAVAAAQPIAHPLRHAAEMQALFVRLAAAERLEAVKGRLLTMAEVKTVGEKGEVQEALDELEAACRGWFEDEEEFQSRIAALKAKAAKVKPAAAPAKKVSGAMSALDGWETVSGNSNSKGKSRKR
ncbi:hypothetical protein JKP88DRAFT_269378 [Tribonema minus]|uniref:Uncharacterized protein n=1 Tax=Tribonema minus TaxID=303371 RepID=A0A835ZCH2_9STRA|nr:hypothetical protein JKP88DRAFT_269378 [Tribonema minus]